MKKIVDSLKIQVQNIFQTSNIAWHQSYLGLENDLEELKQILQCIKNKDIRFQSNDKCDKTVRNQSISCEDSQKECVPKKRGRKTKASTMPSESKGRNDSSDSKSLNDSTASSSSSRSRRAAAQAADQKLAQVQSMVQLKTKLRRPTNFDEKQVKPTLSPPAKCRRTNRNQSAGSGSSQTNEANNEIFGEKNINVMEIGNENGNTELGNAQCSVFLTKLNTPMVNSYINRRVSRSLDRAIKKKSEDLFNDSIPLSEFINKLDASKSDTSHKTNRNKLIRKNDLDSGISSTEEELQQLMKENMPIAHSSPVSIDGEFKGFNNNHREAALARKNTFVVQNEETQVLSKKAQKIENQEGNSEEVEETDTFIKSKTEVKMQKANNTSFNIEEKENVNRNNETFTKKPDNSPNLRSQAKKLKKSIDQSDRSSLGVEKNSEEDSESPSSPETNVRSRTKTIKKHDEKQKEDLKSDREVSGQNLRSRTKTIRKEKEDQSDSTEDESSNMRSRTKTIKKGTTNLENNGLDSENLIAKFGDNPPSNKLNIPPPISPAPAKGELVKKIVEDFEKMQNGMEEREEEKTVGRVTRNAMKSKTTASATETKQMQKMMQSPASLKKNNRKSVVKVKRNKVKEDKENMQAAKLQASGVKQPLPTEQPRMTPLGVNNRMTPSSDSAYKPQANKWTNSANRPGPGETKPVTTIHKQITEEVERKRKEEERLKRQAKEEEAKRKKEKALKATAEEARRKRMEKLQKVAATREAAEKEKERLAVKAEKEKEEKMRQMAIEREKQKEEQLKKKQLMQQKTLEHEERRKQEEAARLAKLKEQEEEHKRIQAMKEREQELQKQQKADPRLVEAEKSKLQGGKLGKIATLNSAKLKMQHGVAPSEKTNGAQSSNCYEITPCREDRPLLPPKSENDYGIDDALSEDSSDDEVRPKKVIPVWAQPKNRERLLKVNSYIPKTLWNLFMECDPCPDINEIFAGNPIKRRIRTSSAVWRTPPMYTRVAP